MFLKINGYVSYSFYFQMAIFYFLFYIFFSGEPYGKILNESEYIIIFYYIYFIK